MYGLMLPSGNDAAIALAFYFGTLLLEEQEKEKVTSSDEEFDNVSYEMEQESEEFDDPNLLTPDERNMLGQTACLQYRPESLLELWKDNQEENKIMQQGGGDQKDFTNFTNIMIEASCSQQAINSVFTNIQSGIGGK